MKYKEYNDYELLYYIADNNDKASNILYEKYKPLIDLKVRPKLSIATIRGLEYNDLIQEGMIGLSEAIRDYKESKDVSFYTFASLCIERQIQSALKKASTTKHKYLNDSLSLNIETDTEKELINIIKDDLEIPFEEKLIYKEEEEELLKDLKKVLTPLQLKVYHFKMKNLTNKEIGKILNKSTKAIECIVHRIRKKTKEIIDNKVSV